MIARGKSNVQHSAHQRDEHQCDSTDEFDGEVHSAKPHRTFTLLGDPGMWPILDGTLSQQSLVAVM